MALHVGVLDAVLPYPSTSPYIDITSIERNKSIECFLYEKLKVVEEVRLQKEVFIYILEII